MADKKPSIDKVTRDIVEINKVFNDTLKREQLALSGDSIGRGKELIRIHNQYSNAVRADGQNLYQMKRQSQSVYDFMVNSLIGPNGENLTGRRSLTGNPKRDEWINRSKLEKLFTTGDSQMTAYFLSTNSDIMHIYDEIDSICAYFYQLEEAVDCIRDNVFSAEQPGSDLNIDINFPSVTDETKLAEYREQVKDALKYENFIRKLCDHIGPKAIKYGSYYVMIVPFREVGAQMAYMDVRTLGSYGMAGSRPIYESVQSSESNNNTKTGTKDDIIAGCKDLLESFIDTTSDDDKKAITEQVDIISENLDKFYVCEDTTPPNVTGMQLKMGSGMTKEIQDMVDGAIKAHAKKTSSVFKTKTTNGTDVPGAHEVDDIQGCAIKLVDPRQMVPIKIFDYVLGYYYFENYDFAKMGTTVTDILSNQLNFNQRNMVIDNIVNSVLRNLKFKDLVESNQEIRTMILNCVLYAQRRDNPIRVKFVPADYVVAFNTNTDQDGNGQPVLLRSLFYGRLYTSLLLFNMGAIITKSTDSEFYYMRESALDAQYSNQVSDLIDQFQDSNVDLISIAQGNLLHANRAINKRYYMSMGTSDQRPFDMEVVSGQQIDIHNEFMTDLKKMAIGSTGVPAVMVDFVDEVEYATMLGMVNIRHLRRANMIAGDFDGPITDVAKLILRYNKTSIPESDLDRMSIVLKKSNTLNNNITSQQLGDVVSTAETMVTQYLGGQNTNPPENQEFIKEDMIRSLVMQMSSGAPWGIMEDIYQKAIISGEKRRLEYKARTSKNQDSGDMSV